MGTQVTHEPPNPATPPENLSVPPAPLETPTPTPPTAQPSDGVIDPKYVKLLEGSLAETNRRLQEAEQRAASAAATPPAPPPNPEEERAQFYNNPKEATRQLIREELENSVGEIRDFVRSFKGASEIDKLVDVFKVNPRYQKMWDSQLEAYIREQAAQIPPANLNEQTFGFIVVSAIGLKATGMFEGTGAPAPTPPAPAPTPTPAPGPTPSPTPSPMPTPPHMRPSPPPGAPANPNSEPNHRPLSELEQRLLREYNAGKPKEKQMTEAQFLIWQTMPAADVAFSDLGKK